MLTLDGLTEALARDAYDVSLPLTATLSVSLSRNSRRVAYGLVFSPELPCWVPLNLQSLRQYVAEEPVTFPSSASIREALVSEREANTRALVQWYATGVGQNSSDRRFQTGMRFAASIVDALTLGMSSYVGERSFDSLAKSALGWSVVAEGLSTVHTSLLCNPGAVNRPTSQVVDFASYYNSLRIDAAYVHAKVQTRFIQEQLFANAVFGLRHDLRPAKELLARELAN